jgi:hypothetical protein
MPIDYTGERDFHKFNTSIDAIKVLRTGPVPVLEKLVVNTENGPREYYVLKAQYGLLDAKRFVESCMALAQRNAGPLPNSLVTIKELEYQVSALRQNLDIERGDNAELRRKLRSITDLIEND